MCVCEGGGGGGGVRQNFERSLKMKKLGKRDVSVMAKKSKYVNTPL